MRYDVWEKAPKAEIEDRPIVPPPATVVIEYERKPVLYLPNGKVLVRRAGY